ncbi:MAG: PQQ-dependent sugar dehydrogenase [Solirubrobacteraceae bacterium]
MRRSAAAVLLAALLTACGSSSGDAQPSAPATASPAAAPSSKATSAATPRATTSAASAKTIATGLHVPWGIAVLPGGDALVAERTTGKILRVPRDGGSKRTVMRVPGVDTNAGEGGLLGLAVSPHYKRDKLVYAYFTAAKDNRIVRFKLGHRPKPILTGLRRGFIHNGGRLAFGPDGKLYAGVGETGETGLAQDRSSLNGKILRMNPDGSVPQGNPFKGSLVWSYGHRNVQGLAFDAQGRLWATEFGQNRFDEVNLIRPGRNYGWPNVEGRGDTAGGRYTNPKVTWRTSDASPSGAAISHGRLYVAVLQGHGLYRIPLSGTSAGTPKLLYGDRYGRVRTVVRVPGGGLWIATSNRDGRGSPKPGDDRIVRVPAS